MCLLNNATEITLIVRVDLSKETHPVTLLQRNGYTHACTYTLTRTASPTVVFGPDRQRVFWHDSGIYNRGISNWPALENRQIIQLELGNQCADTSSITK